MSLYPSLEDMTVGKMAKVSEPKIKKSWHIIIARFLTFLFCLQAQTAQQHGQQAAITQGYQPPPTSTTPGPSAPAAAAGGLYPNLEDEYMGLQLTQYRPVSIASLYKCDL